VLEGNDRRGIDVAVMSKDWIKVTSHAEHTFYDFGLHTPELADYGLDPGDRIFRRDCLEVETNVGNKDLILFVCHFKSMSGGRDKTMCVRDALASPALFDRNKAVKPKIVRNGLRERQHRSRQ